MAIRAANALLNTVVSSQGAIETCSLRGKDGWTVLDGGPDGKVIVGGVLSVNVLNGPGHGSAVGTRGQTAEVALDTQMNTLASNGLNDTWKITADKTNVRSSAVSDGVIVHAGTLSRSLANTNIELVPTEGDLDLDSSVSQTSGNRLGLGSMVDLTLNGRPNASDAKVGLKLKAEGAIDVNDKIVLGGTGSVLTIGVDEGHRVNDAASVSLAGANATYVSGGHYYTMVQNLAQLQAINKSLDGLYVLGSNILGGNYYCTVLQFIGGSTSVFGGALDDPGNSIGNLSISNTGSNVGLFAHSSGILSNLKLNNSRVLDNTCSSGPSLPGALVGINSGRIVNVSASGVSVVGSRLRSNALGSLVGRNINEQITNASVSGGVTAYVTSTAVGGLVGENSIAAQGPEAVIENIHSNIHVAVQPTERNSLGGVGGLVEPSAEVTTRAPGNQGRAGTYWPGLNVGGLAGHNMFGHISGSSANGQVKAGDAGNTGGLISLSFGDKVFRSQASGSVHSKDGLATGGLIGKTRGSGMPGNLETSGSVMDQGGADLDGLIDSNSQSIIKTTEATDKVNGSNNSHVDGLVGYNLGGLATHTVSRGDVSGGFSSLMGRLVGHNGGELVNADASGRVSTAVSTSVGGLVGDNAGSTLSARSSSTINGSERGRIGGLVDENQVQRRAVPSMLEGIVNGDHCISVGGLAGVNLGSIECSGVSGKIGFKPQFHYSQIYGAQIGKNHEILGDNYVVGETAFLSLAGIDRGNIW